MFKKTLFISCTFVLVACTNDPDDNPEVVDSATFHGSSDHWEVEAVGEIFEGESPASMTNLDIEVTYVGSAETLHSPVTILIEDDEQSGSVSHDADMNPNEPYELTLPAPDIIQNYRQDVGIETYLDISWEEEGEQLEERVTFVLEE
ncbi:hypothetical protein ACE1TF_15905 [Geomicrobium sp. JSM 1781026]|uniref:hypothetical protein n=1 Tax=Geomicrobium sp. JSM 1781026 TaxID=3344580 RepID=UPI0035C1C298